jgi:hypothetical protein
MGERAALGARREEEHRGVEVTMTLYLTPFVLIGGLLVLGLLVGAGLVLLTVLRERADLTIHYEAAEEQKRAA